MTSYAISSLLAAVVVTAMLVRQPALRRKIWPWAFYGCLLVCLPLSIALGEDYFWLDVVPMLVLLLAFIVHEYRSLRKGPSLMKPPKF